MIKSIKKLITKNTLLKLRDDYLFQVMSLSNELQYNDTLTDDEIHELHKEYNHYVSLMDSVENVIIEEFGEECIFKADKIKGGSL
jgi:hypothetical protein